MNLNGRVWACAILVNAWSTFDESLPEKRGLRAFWGWIFPLAPSNQDRVPRPPITAAQFVGIGDERLALFRRSTSELLFQIGAGSRLGLWKIVSVATGSIPVLKDDGSTYTPVLTVEETTSLAAFGRGRFEEKHWPVEPGVDPHDMNNDLGRTSATLVAEVRWLDRGYQAWKHIRQPYVGSVKTSLTDSSLGCFASR